MSDLTQSLKVAASGLRAQSGRLRHVTENVANAETPGYRRKMVGFLPGEAPGTVRTGPVQLDRSALEKIYQPSHPMADETGHYTGSNVDLILEIADAREARRSYEANLKMFDQARQMSSNIMELLRK